VSGKLKHPNNPVLTWNAANVVVKVDPAGNIRPAKDRSSEKIDGIVALAMAVGRMMARPGGEDWEVRII
jgi:phage terminase large subunit-like protein